MKTENQIGALIALAQKTPGWNFREHPPQRMVLHGGCVLIVVPPWLWRARIGALQKPQCAPITFQTRQHIA